MTHKCPACEREFRKLEEYPIIYLASFDRVQVPEFIGYGYVESHPEIDLETTTNKPIPRAVRKLFQETGKNILSYEGVIYKKDEDLSGYEGLAWYRSSRDGTKAAKEGIFNPKIQESLSALEGYVGQEVLTKTLLALPGFKEGQKIGNNYCLLLELYEIRHEESDLRKCRINLHGGWSSGIIRDDDNTFSQDVATINYEGRVHK